MESYQDTIMLSSLITKWNAVKHTFALGKYFWKRIKLISVPKQFTQITATI